MRALLRRSFIGVSCFVLVCFMEPSTFVLTWIVRGRHISSSLLPGTRANQAGEPFSFLNYSFRPSRHTQYRATGLLKSRPSSENTLIHSQQLVKRLETAHKLSQAKNSSRQYTQTQDLSSQDNRPLKSQVETRETHKTHTKAVSVNSTADAEPSSNTDPKGPLAPCHKSRRLNHSNV